MGLTNAGLHVVQPRSGQHNPSRVVIALGAGARLLVLSHGAHFLEHVVTAFAVILVNGHFTLRENNGLHGSSD